jgi:hypothetical protein
MSEKDYCLHCGGFHPSSEMCPPKQRAERESWCHDCHCWHPSMADCPALAHLRDARSGALTEGPSNADFSKPLSGGSNDYWKVKVGAPVSGCDAYTAECNDLIEALQMTYAEGNVFKAVWRHALARRGTGKQGNTQKYEAEKAEFFAKRLVEQAP